MTPSDWVVALVPDFTATFLGILAGLAIDRRNTRRHAEHEAAVRTDAAKRALRVVSDTIDGNIPGLQQIADVAKANEATVSAGALRLEVWSVLQHEFSSLPLPAVKIHVADYFGDLRNVIDLQQKHYQAFARPTLGDAVVKAILSSSVIAAAEKLIEKSKVLRDEIDAALQ